MSRFEIKEYRPDINGLRALAVLSVLIFHSFPEFLPGGFVGVDVFFVISGFLITGIIWREIDTGTFSFSQFYARRIRRIFPALIVVLIISTLVGWWILFDDEFKQLGNHAMRATIFLSNFALWREAGYFDAKAELKPLLHLWSLSIEEQFYILWPGLIWFIRKKLHKPLLWLVILILLSLSWNFYQSLRDPAHDFYSPLTRFWELMVGAFWAIGLHTRTISLNHLVRQWCGWIGMVLLLSSMLLCGESSVYPGAWAIWPVLGAILFIASEGEALRLQRVMTLSFVLWVGEISYALYLWHWPILSFLRIIEGQTPSEILRLVGLILSFLLASLTVRYVESYFRTGPVLRYKIFCLLLMMGFMFFWGFTINRTQGFPNRDLMGARYIAHPGDIGHEEFKSEFRKFHDFQITNSNKKYQYNNPIYCYQTKNTRTADIVLLGDSHAEHLLIGLAESLPDKNIIFCGFSGLPVILHPEFSNVAQAVISGHSDQLILLAAQWETRLQELPKGQSSVSVLTATVRALQLSGGKVGLIDDVYRFEFDPQRCKYQRPLSGGSVCIVSRDIADKQFDNYLSTLYNVQKNLDNVTLLEIRHSLCTDAICSMLVNNSLAYRDSHHLSADGSRFIGRILSENILNLNFSNSSRY